MSSGTIEQATEWHGCYDDSWTGTITDKAFAHPAKFAPGLIVRIHDHLRLPRGAVVVDPFGGVGLGGIVFASRGVQWIGCELEAKFVELAKQNFELHRKTWEGFGDPLPVIVQGDSRRLREHVWPVLLSMTAEGADCVVSSPPYLEGEKGHPSLGSVNNDDWGIDGRDITRRRGKTGEYGETPGQLGNMKPGEVDAVVSSPPYEGSQQVDNREKPSSAMSSTWRKRQGEITDGVDPNNIGNQTGDTFWTAARDIVAECYAILKPGGLAVWVTKDFVRKGARVPFSDDWERLCVSCGFESVERIHAQLVKRDSHPSLFGGQETTTKERKSFFRRLAESKGSPPIDHEDVIVMRRP